MIPSPFRPSRPVFVLLVCCLIGNAVCAQAPEKPVVLARVGSHEIFSTELARQLTKVPDVDKLSPIQRERLKSRLLETLIGRQLIMDYLAAETKLGATPEEIDDHWNKWQTRLKQRELTPRQFFENSGWSEEALKRQFAWEIGWPRLMKARLTETALQNFFKKHRRDFDGTRLRVAQILWSVQGNDVSSPLARAKEVRERIKGGELSFTAAVRKYSVGPSAERDGVLGWIERDHPMPETFSAAAFKLEVGELSAPVVTQSGIHLIQVLEIEPGSRMWEEVRDKVTRAARIKLFHYLSDRARKTATIEYPAALPGDGEQ